MGVPQFIDKMLNEYYQKDDQQKIVDGLAKVESEAQRINKKSFVELSGKQMDKILIRFDQEAKNAASKIDDEHNIEAIKNINLLFLWNQFLHNLRMLI